MTIMMENKEDDLKKEIEARNEEATLKLLEASDGLLSSIFNARALHSFDHFLEYLSDVFQGVVDTTASVARKIMTVKSLKEIENIDSKIPLDGGKAIADWYDDNSDMQPYASSKFRKPEYPIRKPF